MRQANTFTMTAAYVAVVLVAVIVGVLAHAASLPFP
jgi:hypothetical protein